MTKEEAYEEAIRRLGDGAGVVELADQGEGVRCLVGRWVLAVPAGEVSTHATEGARGPMIFFAKVNAFRVHGEGATFAAAFELADLQAKCGSMIHAPGAVGCTCDAIAARAAE